MKTHAIRSLSASLLLAVLLLPAAARAEAPAPKGDPVTAAEAFLRLLEKGSFGEAAKGFDATMAAALSEAKLAETWKGLMAQVGKLKSVDERRTKVDQAMTIVDLICTFEKSPLLTRVVYDGQGKISGLWFKPVGEAIPASAPAAAR